jgi:hypothetical protein
MTTHKHLKARIRERMARTGERYTTARRHVAGVPEPRLAEHAGYLLRGGTHPDTAALAHVLAHRGAGLSEAMVLGVGGGLGAGYILWEFAAHDAPILVLGFRKGWQYPERWVSEVLARLEVPARIHHTGGRKAAAAHLDAALAAREPALCWVDRQLVGHWHLPAHLEGHAGYPVVVHGVEGERVLVDDRTLAPLSVPRPTLDAARARIGSYKHRLVVPEPAGPVPEATLREAVVAGIADQVEHLTQRSDSFSLPGWRKWARLMTDTRAAKAWPRVFAQRRGVVSALLSTYEGIEPLGTFGGHLRGLYAEFLEEAAELLALPVLRERAQDWREIAQGWHELAEAALPDDVPDFARLREGLVGVYEPVIAEGDAGAERAREAARELWALRARLDADPPLDSEAMLALFADLGARLGALFAAESAAIEALRDAGVPAAA